MCKDKRDLGNGGLGNRDSVFGIRGLAIRGMGNGIWEWINEIVFFRKKSLQILRLIPKVTEVASEIWNTVKRIRSHQYSYLHFP